MCIFLLLCHEDSSAVFLHDLCSKHHPFSKLPHGDSSRISQCLTGDAAKECSSHLRVSPLGFSLGSLDFCELQVIKTCTLEDFPNEFSSIVLFQVDVWQHEFVLLLPFFFFFSSTLSVLIAGCVKSTYIGQVFLMLNVAMLIFAAWSCGHWAGYGCIFGWCPSGIHWFAGEKCRYKILSTLMSTGDDRIVHSAAICEATSSPPSTSCPTNREQMASTLSSYPRRSQCPSEWNESWNPSCVLLILQTTIKKLAAIWRSREANFMRNKVALPHPSALHKWAIGTKKGVSMLASW